VRRAISCGIDWAGVPAHVLAARSASSLVAGLDVLLSAEPTNCGDPRTTTAGELFGVVGWTALMESVMSENIEVFTRREAARKFARERVAAGSQTPSITNTVPWAKNGVCQRLEDALSFSGFEIEAPPMPLDQRVIEQLMVSISEFGQAEPLAIRGHDDGRLTLLGGWHRAAALKNIGRTSASALVISGLTDKEARLWQLVDNLHRKVPCAMDRAKSDFELLHAMQERVSQGATPLGGLQPADKFHAKAAALFGASADRMARSAKIAQITSAAESKIRELKLENNQSALLKIAGAGTATESQITKAIELVQRPKRRPKLKILSPEVACSDNGTTGSTSRTEPTAEAATMMATRTEAPELAQEVEPLGVVQRAEPMVGPPEVYPDLPGFLERRPLDAEFKKVNDEWRSSRLRAMLESGPVEARTRYVWELLFVEFPEAFVEAMPRTTGGDPL
jgi:hypothetical protein